MAQSKSKKKMFNMAYSFGAVFVIIGALFKIQHWDYGSEILTFGMIVEAMVFALSGFDTVEEDLDWTKVYPELGEGSSEESSQGMLAKKLDKMLQESNLDVELMNQLGDSVKNFQVAAEGLSVASESISSTTKYNEQIEAAASQMESLNGLYQVQVENANRQAELNSNMIVNSERLQDQMESLARNLSSLNGVYGGMLSAMSSNK